MDLQLLKSPGVSVVSFWVNVIGRAHTTGENEKWGETKQRIENQVAFNSVLGPSYEHRNS
jgi:hypothetical protein